MRRNATGLPEWLTDERKPIIGLIVLLLGSISCHRNHPSFEAARTVEPSTEFSITERRSPKPRPPDIAGCTHIEVRYLHPFLSQGKLEHILSPEAVDRVKSKDLFIVRAPEAIRGLAEKLQLGTYVGTNRFTGVQFTAHLDCYERYELVASFEVSFVSILTAEGHLFEYPRDFSLVDLLWRSIPELRPVVFQVNCAGNLADLRRIIRPRNSKQGRYPSPARWCDAIVAHYRAWDDGEEYNIEARAHRLLTCPSAPNAKSHYAMNPNCEPGSPPDMVLLFECTGGWNQYGGPELFTFDHHEPRGGSVILNDGTLKFIRTKEQLHQLRWK